MDTKKIGSFLKELRIEHAMTQEQLGEKLGVSNKTVSRWETGNYMPPVDSLSTLSDIYGISINEILAGTRVATEQFTEIAEKNIIVTLKDANKENEIFKNRMMWILAITTVLTIIIDVLLPMESVKDVVVLILVNGLALIANTLNVIAVASKCTPEKGDCCKT
jgi:transcriptional regulator with XRE-family HTH domain